MKNLTINVGDYVRTNDGRIFKITKEVELEMLNRHNGDDRFVYAIKSSPNIIDLIEVGDYVNGEKVCYLKGDIEKSEVAFEEDVLYTEYNDEYGEWYGYEEDEIETIVTKEQFESMEYKI